MRIRLEKMGYDNQLIGMMKPEEAHDILDGKLTKNEYIFIKVKKLIEEL